MTQPNPPHLIASQAYASSGRQTALYWFNQPLAGTLDITPELLRAQMPHGIARHTCVSMALPQAINDAIWGEIAQRHLPHGGVRTLAIVAIDQTETDQVHVVRQAASTAQQQACPGESGKIPLHGIAERWAAQIATARIIGIPPGPLGLQGLALDGRLGDFAYISATPDFSNYILGDTGAGLWDDHQGNMDALQLLAAQQGREDGQEIADHFLHHLLQNEDRALASLIGLPPGDHVGQAAAGLVFNDADKLEIGRQLKRVLRSAGPAPIPYEGGFDAHVLAQQIQQAARMIGVRIAPPTLALRDGRHARPEMHAAIAAATSQAGIDPACVARLITRYVNDA
ncbi:hypothetical protein SAMN02745857_04082 [Andreprevotia lacus DSM 23236]|jgi:hypothetical protein|uniref:Uncharacterized protein n=2 Tax=Andreprevotia TaxID=397275 RepID=A0A1W1Y0S6_9NEIS|nr:hypothetical protein SAMN02745857_04082 [Andreprevotia lacus DSM 23236]